MTGSAAPDEEEQCTAVYSGIRRARQRLFWCVTCYAGPDSERYAICEICSETCHTNHSLVDIGSKRSPASCRCIDNCSWRAEKGRTDYSDRVAHALSRNAEGLFCRCGTGEQGEMLQCGLCEDWFHDTCLNPGVTKLPESEFELTCHDCVVRLPSLLRYFAQWGAIKPKKRRRKSTIVLPPLSTTRRKVCTAVGSTDVNSLDGLDLLWVPGYRTALCRCMFCKAEYASARMKFIVDRRDFLDPSVPSLVDRIESDYDEADYLPPSPENANTSSSSGQAGVPDDPLPPAIVPDDPVPDLPDESGMNDEEAEARPGGVTKRRRIADVPEETLPLASYEKIPLTKDIAGAYGESRPPLETVEMVLNLETTEGCDHDTNAEPLTEDNHLQNPCETQAIFEQSDARQSTAGNSSVHESLVQRLEQLHKVQSIPEKSQGEQSRQLVAGEPRNQQHEVHEAEESCRMEKSAVNVNSEAENALLNSDERDMVTDDKQSSSARRGWVGDPTEMDGVAERWYSRFVPHAKTRVVFDFLQVSKERLGNLVRW